MGSNFKIYAYIHTPDNVLVVHMKSFGVFKGREELSVSSEMPDGRLTDLVAKFNRMKRPSPMTFSWLPSGAVEKNFFRKLLGKDLIIELTVGNERYSWKLYFGGVKLAKRPYHDKKNERVNVTFSKFDPPF
jgi:hypothetical protein